MLRRPDASLYPARPICYADDLQSFASSLPGLQDTAILVLVCPMVFNLTIAVHKLRAFHYCGLSAPPKDPEALPSLLRNSAAAPKTFAPLRLKTCTSRSGKVDSASNDSPRWSNNANETASADYLHMGISGLSLPYKLSVTAGIPVHTTHPYRP